MLITLFEQGLIIFEDMVIHSYEIFQCYQLVRGLIMFEDMVIHTYFSVFNPVDMGPDYHM